MIKKPEVYSAKRTELMVKLPIKLGREFRMLCIARGKKIGEEVNRLADKIIEKYWDNSIDSPKSEKRLSGKKEMLVIEIPKSKRKKIKMIATKSGLTVASVFRKEIEEFNDKYKRLLQYV